MPEMSGLELLETVKKEKISDAEFVLLTGYDDFAYTQKAIRNGCLDYILKPVEEEELISVLRKVTNINKESIILRKDREKMEDAYLARVIRHLIRGKFNDEDIDYANKHLQLLGNMRFIYIELVHSEIEDEDSDSDEYDMSAAQKQLFTLRQTLETAEADYETAKREAEDRRAEYDRIHKDCIQREQALQREIDTRVAGIDDAEDMLRGAEERIGEAQAVLDEANDIHSTPEVTEALLASVNQQQAAINAQKARIDELATSEKSLRESTRGKRFLCIGVIAAAVILLIVILWLIFGPK
jgi:YesN/AraC family two-component response regulator